MRTFVLLLIVVVPLALLVRWAAGDEVARDTGDGVPVRLVVEPARVAGRVVTPEGAGLMGAEVAFVGPDGAVLAHGTSGVDGQFVLRGEACGAAVLRVTAAAAGRLAAAVDVSVLPRDGLEIALRRHAALGAVGGRVVDGEGVPVAGAQVRFTARAADRGADREVPVVVEGLSGLAGTFRLDRIPAGRGTLRVAGPQHADFVLHVNVARGEVVELGTVAVAAAQWVTLVGRVLDAAGRGIAGADVAVAGSRVVADAAGWFSLTRVRPGPVVLTVTAGGVWQMFDVAVPPDGEHAVELAMAVGSGVVAGRVVCDGVGVPFARVAFGARSLRGPAGAVRADADGVFRLVGIVGGAVDLSVQEVDPWRSHAFEALAVGRDDHVLELPPLPAPGTIRGRVLDVDGAPVAGAEVFAGDGEMPTVLTRSDGDGHYLLRLRVSEDGAARIGATHAAHLPVSHAVRVPLDGEGELLRDLVLVPIAATATVVGTVTDAAGAPVEGADCSVRITLCDGSLLESFDRTDSLGHFACDRVPAGPAELRIAPPGHPPRTTHPLLKIGARHHFSVTVTGG